MHEDFDAALTEAIAKARRHSPQYAKFVERQNQLIQSGTCLLTGASYREDYEQFLRLVGHVEELWGAACTLFRSKYYSQALSIAISTLEETGKIGVARFQMGLRQAGRDSGSPAKVPPKVSRRRNPFFSHPEKHLLVAGAGAIVNSRLDRILGRKRVSQFLEDVSAGTLERLRQSALYADVGREGPVLPCDLVCEKSALFYVVLAGELMAEILGFEPLEWERLLASVQAFEREVGHRWE